jgi:23S rRNA pseudouridine1911/1915/1917 synthase
MLYLVIRFRVEDDQAGERIDKVVTRHLSDIGRRGARELFAERRVIVDGRVARKGDRAGQGAEVVVHLEENEFAAPEPDLPLRVILETQEVVVVGKPAGQPSAPIRIGQTGTLANAIIARYPETLGVGYRSREPGLLHRLDTQTSGLLVVARTRSVFDRLRQALSEGRIEKRYLAVVSAGGAKDSGVVDECLAPDPADTRRVRVAPRGSPGARPAVTRFRAIRSGARFRLLEVEVSHAYRHQVRAHLSWIGAPIAGDALYGGDSVPALGERHALHASYVAWAGDDVVPAFSVEDPLPPELEALFSA